MNLTLQFLAFGPKLSKPFYYEKTAADYPEPELNENVPPNTALRFFDNIPNEHRYSDIANPYNYINYLIQGGDLGRRYRKQYGNINQIKDNPLDLFRYNFMRDTASQFARKVKPILPELKDLDTTAHQAISPLAIVGLQTSGKVVNPVYEFKKKHPFPSTVPNVFNDIEPEYVDYNDYRKRFGLDAGVDGQQIKGNGIRYTGNTTIGGNTPLSYGAPYAAYLRYYGDFAPTAYEMVHGMKPFPYDIAMARKVIGALPKNSPGLKGLIGVNEDGTPIYQKSNDNQTSQPNKGIPPTTGVLSNGGPITDNNVSVAPPPRLKSPTIPIIADEGVSNNKTPVTTYLPKTPVNRPNPNNPVPSIPRITEDSQTIVAPPPRLKSPTIPKSPSEPIRSPKVTPTPTQEYTPRTTPSVSPKYTERNDNDYKPLVTENTPKSIGVGTPDKKPPIKDPSYTVIGPGGTWQAKRYGGY